MWCSAMSIEVTLQSKGIVSYRITEISLYTVLLKDASSDNLGDMMGKLCYNEW